MALATWWDGDALSHLSPLAGFSAGLAHDDQTLAHLNNLMPVEVHRRRQAGHQPYLAYLAGEPVAYGWVATRQAEIGEHGLNFTLPEGHRYLWDFATLPAWRGRGIYPHLLQEILTAEVGQADYFWIIYAPENQPSGAGIHKAGLNPIGQLSFQRDGHAGLTPLGQIERARTGANLLGVPLLERGLSPCWRCGGASLPSAQEGASCTCRAELERATEGTMLGCLCLAGDRSGR
jgi:GNAT superfamily N-acetyltransferase